ELRAENQEREALVRGEVDPGSGVAELRRALAGAVAASQWSAAVTAARALTELDGSGDALAPGRPISADELLRTMSGMGPVVALAGRLIYWRERFGSHPEPPDDDIELCRDGLRHWLSDRQLELLGRRLLGAKP